MFNCAFCKESIGPGVKPVRVITGHREVSYHNTYFVEDEWGVKQKREVDSVGTEITGEAMLCAKDADEQLAIPPDTARKTTLTYGHAFEEKLAERMHVKMIGVVTHSALDRVGHNTKRGVRDSMIVVPLVKHFVDTNKGYTF